MILTITLNPAVDISYKFEYFLLDNLNRIEDISKTAGGKGLNVARVLRQLDQDVAASGFLGGHLGSFISTEIKEFGIQDYFIQISGETRNCVALIHDGKQTEILENGPVISQQEASLFLEKFIEYVQQVEIVTISGSLPQGLSKDFYLKLIAIANKYEVRVILDVHGELLTPILESKNKPFLIKPNREELKDLLGEKSMDEVQIMKALISPLFINIPWVVVTLGAKGAIVKHDKKFYKANAPIIEAINPVGSGDSVVAGFAAGLIRGLGDKDLIKFALSIGVLNAMEEKTGYISVQRIDWAIKEIKVEIIE